MTTARPVIDTHAHVYPARYLDKLEVIGVAPHSTAIARNLRASDEPEDMRARLAMMDAAGVGIQVLSATPQVPLVVDADAAAEAARMVNDIYAQILADHPGRFLAYGAVQFNHPDEALEAISYCLDELGFVGVAINTLLPDPGAAITDKRFAPVFAELNRRASIVYIHPTGNGAYSRPISDHGLTWVNGAPTEDSIAVLHLLKGNYPNIYPDLRFHVAHLGGDIPFLAQRIEDNYEDWGAFPASPRETLRRMWFDAANFSAGALRLSAEVYDPRRILAGSDYPYFQDEKYIRAFTYIREAGLPDEAIRDILGGNATQLYGERVARR
ncbi:amidohydrolase family protein [Mycobacterium sp. DL440]|uniref:amidohydrolase family protein n=1 Tax=Mycobacterium sp. DL440 TaxID=2675523 RepID=UPI00142411EA|nr:amidohydrolase family protein [Mycobacterium sp. DL440]